jgi:YVTN family beta-propeller protein
VAVGMLVDVTRRPILAFALLIIVVIAGFKVAASQDSGSPSKPVTAASPKAKPTPTPTKVATPAPSLPSGPSDARRLHKLTTITGSITPKSVDASSSGIVTAQNMIYQHSITVYDDSTYKLRKTIPDRVTLSQFGFAKYAKPVQGGPVEAAFTPDGKYEYVSNYSMYGPGFGHPGHDTCSPGKYDRSFLYRINVSTLAIDQVIQVGAVPKYLAVTPNGEYVLVANWCSYTLSVVSTSTGKEIRQLHMGAYPRGIAVNATSSTAYVAIMGSTEIAKVDLADFSVSYIHGVGSGPRHLVMDPAGRYLYVTLNGAGKVVKLDLKTDHVVDTVSTGHAPRSMTIAPDGRSLYVVNYESNDVSKVRTSDMKVLQVVKTPVHPIGITFDARTGDVWVACYQGQVVVFADR